MNALLAVDGAGFQPVSYKALLGVKATKDQLHLSVHFERGLFIIDRQEHTVRSVVKCEEHRAYATQDWGPKRELRWSTCR